MIGTTLNLILCAGTPLRLWTDNRLSFSPAARSDGKMYLAGRIHCRAAIHAESMVETAKQGTTLYEVLQVKRNASPTEIKTAYRSLAKLYHPDATSSSDGRDFMEIHRAYATLSDPAARAVYDLSLMSTTAGSGSQLFRYAPPANYSGSYPTRRWETDQCW